MSDYHILFCQCAVTERLVHKKTVAGSVHQVCHEYAHVCMGGSSQDAVEHCNGLTAQWQIGAHVALENIYGTEMGFVEKQQNFVRFYGNPYLYMYHCLNIINTQTLLLIQS
jgi:hypothetical protein